MTIIIITIAAITLALLLGVAVAATLGERARQLAFVPARRLAVSAQPASRRISSPLPRI